MRKREWDQETVENLENLVLELNNRIYEDILTKSALWVELLKDRDTKYKSSTGAGQKKWNKAKEVDLKHSRCGNRAITDPRAIGSSDEEVEQTKGLSDMEIVRRQIRHYYDQT